jgi:hypothetical protein
MITFLGEAMSTGLPPQPTRTLLGDKLSEDSSINSVP